VVIFDRIRENLRIRKKESFDQIINRSINEVHSRTFITGLTTFLAVMALFLFGGEVIHDFALAILLGVVIGTYSSWFVASPLLLVGRGKRSEVKVLKRA
jgi:preprotein translocase subunit SecF